MKMYDNGGIAGELHMNRLGYQWGGPGGYSPGTPIDSYAVLLRCRHYRTSSLNHTFIIFLIRWI
jgi:hypothetical protein